MQKLYVAMVGLPASGKSTLARRIRDDLTGEGIRTAIFNNGEMRRRIAGPDSTSPEFYAPENEDGRDLREQIALRNMEEARRWLENVGQVAVLDATNASRQRRKLIEDTLTDYPVLFVECLNEDPVLREACIRRKANLPEYATYAVDDAVTSFKARIKYYESIYTHVGEEKYWMQVDSMANRIMNESPLEGSQFYPAIRELLANSWVKNLYLIRHGQTDFNVEGRIGGDPLLSAKGRSQAEALARHMEGKVVDWIFTSTRRRSHETASYLIKSRPLTNADKFNYCYPGGESYAMLLQRVQRGLRRALFLSGGASTVIVGHQAINRILLSMFLRQRTEDIPYMFVPQDHYYHIEATPRRKLVERIPYAQARR